MSRPITKAWAYGLIAALVIFTIGSLLNFKTSTIAAPTCENQEHVDYVGCPSNSDGKYYVTGWPQEMYCYSDGKESCSPWNDFILVERHNERSKLWKQNLQQIIMLSMLGGLLATASLLTLQLKGTAGHDKNSRD